MDNDYEKLWIELLAQFYLEFHKNIQKGLLSPAMHHEINLIKDALFKKGYLIVEAERMQK